MRVDGAHVGGIRCDGNLEIAGGRWLGGGCERSVRPRNLGAARFTHPASAERRMKKLCRNEMLPKENAWFSGYGWSSLGRRVADLNQREITLIRPREPRSCEQEL